MLHRHIISGLQSGMLLAALIVASIRPVSGQGWNMTLAANYDDNSLPFNGTVTYNDIWGYSSAGKEYAILGGIKGTLFIEVTNPNAPVLRDYEFGADTNSTWRDYKTYQNYCYAVGDVGNATLQIFDLSFLPDSVHKVYDSNALFTKGHTIFIDDNSDRLYVAGPNNQTTGILVIDISTPTAPSLLVNANLGNYVHQVFARNDTVYCFMGTGNGFQVWDFTNVGSPSNIATYNSYPGAATGYSHSGWMDEDNTYMIHTDETHDHAVKITDISNLASISTPATFKSTLLGPTWTNSVAHNPFVKGSKVYISYYWDGVQVYDISDPLVPRQRAYWDTEPANALYFGFGGCWGVYPFLPSGNIIASDINNGLFILQETATFPVELVDFQCEKFSGKVLLSWKSWSESNTGNFVVERALGESGFTEIGTVTASGTSGTYKNYDFIDDSGESGKRYYRLRINDLDGNYEYSKTVVMDLQNEFTPSVIYPNPVPAGSPFQFEISFHTRATAQLNLFDLAGKSLWNKMIQPEPGSMTFVIDPGTIAAGTYILEVVSGETRFRERIVVEK